MRRVKLSRLFPGVRGKIANQVFVDEAENIIVLFPIHWNILNQLNQIADRLCTRSGCIAQLGKAGIQRIKDFLEYLLVLWVN